MWMLKGLCMQAACTAALKFTGNNVGDISAEALARLKNACALRMLTLNLTSNGVGDSGAHALQG